MSERTSECTSDFTVCEFVLGVERERERERERWNRGREQHKTETAVQLYSPTHITAVLCKHACSTHNMSMRKCFMLQYTQYYARGILTLLKGTRVEMSTTLYQDTDYGPGTCAQNYILDGDTFNQDYYSIISPSHGCIGESHCPQKMAVAI